MLFFFMRGPNSLARLHLSVAACLEYDLKSKICTWILFFFLLAGQIFEGRWEKSATSSSSFFACRAREAQCLSEVSSVAWI